MNLDAELGIWRGGQIKIEHMECKFCKSMNKCEGFVRVDDQEIPNSESF